MCSRLNMQTHASIAPDNDVTLTFHLLSSESVLTDCHAFMSPKFGVDSSSLFTFALQTYKQTKSKTHLVTLPTP